jgi:uncharacterized glyoxalase superfamily protein PhnB
MWRFRDVVAGAFQDHPDDKPQVSVVLDDQNSFHALSAFEDRQVELAQARGVGNHQLDLQAMDAKGAPKPAGPGDRITHASLEADGARIVGTDGHPDFPAKVGENIALALRGIDKDRLTQIFHALGEGGKVKMPPSDQSGGVGWLTDKFEVNWMVSIVKG